MPAPVYLFTGFLDSGKTTTIKDTLNDKTFMEGVNRTLLLLCEEGEVPFEEDFIKEKNLFVEKINDPSELTHEKMHELDTLYHPDQVFIEWNGIWAIPEELINGMPQYWPLVQTLGMVDASTFETYMNALRGMLFEQLRYCDTIIVNRCNEQTNARSLRGNIKAINQGAQIFYEGAFGAQVDLKDGLLPFNINDPILDIKDEDYGLWYMDAVENPMKYANKKVILRGFYAENIEGYKQSFIFGRRALVCCANDTSLCGLTVTGVKIDELNIGDWIEVEGELKPIPMDNGMQTVVLFASRVQRYEKLANECVTFS